MMPAFSTFCLLRLRSAPATDKVPDQRNDPDDRKDVNGETRAVGEHFAQNPQQKQNTGYAKKHIALLRCLHLRGHTEG